MELTNQGFTLWFATPDTPCPDAVLAGGPPVVTVGVSPASASNRVDVRFRVNGAPPRVARANLFQTDYRNRRQYFRAPLPALAPGSHVEYSPVLSNAGRILSAPDFPAAFTVPIPEPAPAANLFDPANTSPAIALGRFPFKLEYLFGVTSQMRREVIGETPDGLRLNFLVQSGVVRGPRLNGKFHSDGGDWMRIRPDGIGIPNIHVTFELDDGALILMESAGTFDLGPNGYAAALTDHLPPTGTFMSTPRFYSSHPDYAWLVRASTFGVGLVDLKQFIVRDDVFQVVRAEAP